MNCAVQGTLDRNDGPAHFTHFAIQATLTVPQGANLERAQRLMEKAEKACIIANSLRATVELQVTINEQP